MERKLISFDWAIKRLLRSKAHFVILEGFLSELLHKSIKILEVLDSETNKEIATSKVTRVDIKVKDENEQIFIIEVQYYGEFDFLKRILFNTSKTIVEHFSEVDPYSKIVKVISVNILYFDFDKGNDYIYHGTTDLIGIHSKKPIELSENQRSVLKGDTAPHIYPEYYLIDVKNFDNSAKDTIDEWIYFLKNETIKDSFTAQGIQEAKEKLDVLKMSIQERKEYEAFQDELHSKASIYESYIVVKREGEQIGIEKGKKIGETKKAQIVAENAIKKGLDNSLIAELTGLSITEIEALRKRLAEPPLGH